MSLQKRFKCIRHKTEAFLISWEKKKMIIKKIKQLVLLYNYLPTATRDFIPKNAISDNKNVIDKILLPFISSTHLNKC